MAEICFYARFEDSAGDGVNGLAVTWDIDRVVRATGVRDALVTGGANSIVFSRRGLYGYLLAGANIITYDYIGTAITASATPTAHEIAAVWTLWSLSWYDVATSVMTIAGSIGKLFVDYLDASVSSRSVAGDAMTLADGAITAAKIAQDAIDAICAADCISGLASNILSLLQNYGVVKKACTDINIYRGDTWTYRMSGLGDLTGNTDIWFGVKEKKSDDDASAKILISRTVGLERINGAAAGTPANGSITVVGAATNGVIDIVLDEVEAAKLSAKQAWYWDVQKKVGGVVTSPKCGRCIITDDVVRATS